MDILGLTPEIQTIITKDGLTIPSLHKLWENSRSRKRLNTITDADFYFPEKKLAVFVILKNIIRPMNLLIKTVTLISP